MTEWDCVQYFAMELDTWMKRRNISINKLAKRSGVSKSEVSRILNGQRMPKLNTIINLSKALGIETSDLTSFADEYIR